MTWPRHDLFGDLRVRNGIKLGLAGLLALFCAQMLGVPNDTWAILTVFVLMDAKYVGALAFKASMRITGTIVGAIIGVWLASDYASTPVIFLSVFFVVIAFAGYEVGQVGARQVPYAYYLLGLTTLTIASEGVTDPAHAWQTGVDRTEEILIGIISSLLVSSLVWPRYAREEFLEAGRAALKTIGQLFSLHAEVYLTPANARAEIQQLHRTFDKQFSRLKNLLQIGSRESAVFSARLETYNAFMVSLTNLFHAGLDLSRHRGETCFLEQLEPEMRSLFVAICEEFEILTSSVSVDEKMGSSSMNDTFAGFEEKVHKIRDLGMLLRAPLQTAMDFAGEFASLRAVRDELNSIRNAMEGLPGGGQPDSEASSFVRLSRTSSSARSRGTMADRSSLLPRSWKTTDTPSRQEKSSWDFLPTIDWSSVRVGIKGGIAVVIAIICLRWIHPPGAANVPTWSWLFVIFPRTFLQLSGDSDLRGFQN
ncbi:MAG TPA: FUSC family protein, partial [Chthoniobacterales bacterium]|nr:FUSC family protein [Chthoniobacterales bacterium]